MLPPATFFIDTESILSFTKVLLPSTTHHQQYPTIFLLSHDNLIRLTVPHCIETQLIALSPLCHLIQGKLSSSNQQLLGFTSTYKPVEKGYGDEGSSCHSQSLGQFCCHYQSSHTILWLCAHGSTSALYISFSLSIDFFPHLFLHINIQVNSTQI